MKRRLRLFLLFVISYELLGPAVISLAQSVNFSPPSHFAAGGGPQSVAVGDFNGDGKQDLAVVNFNGNNVSILLGTGAGSFGAATNFGAGDGPRSVAVGDFNRDGKQDLVVANFNGDNVSILLGTGTGNFGAATNFGAGDGPRSVAVGDFNGDGKQDLAVANFNGGGVSILLGNGDGSFGAATNFGAGSGPPNSLRSVVVGDFNGDRKQDLAVANIFAVSILLGNGDGSFGAATNFGAGLFLQSVAVGDFNADGKQDLVVADGDSSIVSILLGDGNGSFGARTVFFAGNHQLLPPSSVAVGDFNGDGKQDLAVANGGSNEVSILLGDGNGSFGGPTNFAVLSSLLSSPNSVAVGDFNGDGKQDLAATNGGSDNVSIFLNTTHIVSITDVTVIEGNGGAVTATFQVKLSDPSSQVVTVSFSTADGTATAGSDYVAQSGTLTFNPGETTKTITVAINGDAVFQPNKTFLVNLTSASNAAIIDSRAVGTIRNDDPVPPERLGNVSTRGQAETGHNVMIGGFIVDGSTPMRVLIRGRGPSMSGAPFFVSGTLANPLLRLFSGPTLIAQNDDWQVTDALCGAPATNCGGVTEIIAAGLDPCQPNPGQASAPPGCAQESAILITLLPGGYTVHLSGVGGGTGVGLVEVFDAEHSSTADLTNISTRDVARTGAGVMIGGFIIEGSTPKTVLLRGRGPSMSGAPFNIPGTLADPVLQLFSNQTVIGLIGFNNNWQDLQAEEILSTLLDPCQPNPGQTISPLGCNLESAILLHLPPGAYTAFLTGVGGATGVGLVEVFELPNVVIPNAVGRYVGTASVTFSSCQNPANNGLNNFSSVVGIDGQNRSLIIGAGRLSGPTTVSIENLFGTATKGGDVMGSFRFTQPGASGEGTFTGFLTGNTLVINFAGQVTLGETCSVNGLASGTR